MVEYLHIMERGLMWEPIYGRACQDLELEEIGRYMKTYQFRGNGEGEDEREWEGHSGQSQSYPFIHFCMVGKVIDSFPWRQVWKAGASVRVAFLVWTAALDAICYY